jgi:hypothetical protein
VGGGGHRRAGFPSRRRRPRRGGEEWRWGVSVRVGRVEFIYDRLNGLLVG